MPRNCWLASLVLSLFVSGCTSPAEPMESAEPEPSVAVPSTEADEAALRQLIQALDDALIAGSVDDLLATYTADAVEMPNNEPVHTGREAIRARYEDFLGNNTDTISSTIDEIQVAGDWASVRLSYTESWTPKAGGDTTTVVGKTLAVCSRQTDGAWKIATIIWNSDSP